LKAVAFDLIYLQLMYGQRYFTY